MSTLKVSEIQSNTLNAPPLIKDSAGVQVGTFCRAWVNFNGTGTVAIRASFNVLGITDFGAGNYGVNFTNAMPDTNYITMFSNEPNASSNYLFVNADPTVTSVAPTTSQVRVGVRTSAGAAADILGGHVAIFR